MSIRILPHKLVLFSTTFYLSVFLFLNAFTLSAQSEVSLNVEGGAIEVSEALYEEIANWIKDVENNQTTTLLSHLQNSSIDKREIDAFLSSYYTGNASVNGVGCNCKTVIPATNFVRPSNSWLPKAHDHKGEIRRLYTHWDGAAIYFNHQVGYTKTYKAKHETGNKIERHRFLVLCTEMGVVEESCNCNKQIYFENDYYSIMEMIGESWGMFSHEYKLRLRSNYVLFTFEENNSLNNLNTQWGINGAVVALDSLDGGYSLSFSFGNYVSAITQLAGYVFNIINPLPNNAPPATNQQAIVAAIDGIIQVDPYTGSGSSSALITKHYVGNATLRANIPFNIVLLSDAEIQGGGKNNHNTIGHIKSQTRFSAYIPLNTHSYDMYGDLEPDSRYNCCNEALGIWSHSTMFADNGKEGDYESATINHLNNFGFNNYSYSEVGLVMSDGRIYALGNDVGSVYSTTNCFCNNLINESHSGNGQLIEPRLMSDQYNYCNEDFMIYLSPISWTADLLLKFQNGDIDIRWFHNGVAISPTDPNHPNAIICNAPGSYWVEFVSMPEEECRTIDFLTILPCDQGKNNELLPAISSNLIFDPTKQMDYEMKLYPNPVADNFLNIILESNTESEILDFVVINLSGQIVSKGQATTNKAIELNMENLPQGQYFVKCIVHQSGYQKALKFVKL